VSGLVGVKTPAVVLPANVFDDVDGKIGPVHRIIRPVTKTKPRPKPGQRQLRSVLRLGRRLRLFGEVTRHPSGPLVERGSVTHGSVPRALRTRGALLGVRADEDASIGRSRLSGSGCEPSMSVPTRERSGSRRVRVCGTHWQVMVGVSGGVGLVRVKVQVCPTGRGVGRCQVGVPTTAVPSRSVQEGAPGAGPRLVTVACKTVVFATDPGVTVMVAL
jgi:hypothetical protein